MDGSTLRHRCGSGGPLGKAPEAVVGLREQPGAVAEAVGSKGLPAHMLESRRQVLVRGKHLLFFPKPWAMGTLLPRNGEAGHRREPQAAIPAGCLSRGWP